MKKAKIMFMALAVLAVVGGTLAFKARVQRTIYCTSQASPNACIAGALLGSTTTTDVNQPLLDCSTVSNPTGACNQTRFTTSIN